MQYVSKEKLVNIQEKAINFIMSKIFVVFNKLSKPIHNGKVLRFTKFVAVKLASLFTNVCLLLANFTRKCLGIFGVNVSNYDIGVLLAAPIFIADRAVSSFYKNFVCKFITIVPNTFVYLYNKKKGIKMSKKKSLTSVDYDGKDDALNESQFQEIIKGYKLYLEQLGYPNGEGMHILEKYSILMMSNVAAFKCKNWVYEKVIEHFKNEILSKEPESITKTKLLKLINDESFFLFNYNDMSIQWYLQKIFDLSRNPVPVSPFCREFVLENAIKYINKNFNVENIQDASLVEVLDRYCDNFDKTQEVYWFKKGGVYNKHKDMFTDIYSNTMRVIEEGMAQIGKPISFYNRQIGLNINNLDFQTILINAISYKFEYNSDDRPVERVYLDNYIEFIAKEILPGYPDEIVDFLARGNHFGWSQFYCQYANSFYSMNYILQNIMAIDPKVLYKNNPTRLATGDFVYSEEKEIVGPLLILGLYHAHNQIRCDKEFQITEDPTKAIRRTAANPITYWKLAVEKEVNNIKSNPRQFVKKLLVGGGSIVSIVGSLMGYGPMANSTVLKNGLKLLGGVIISYALLAPKLLSRANHHDADVPRWQPSMHHKGYKKVQESMARYRAVNNTLRKDLPKEKWRDAKDQVVNASNLALPSPQV